MPISPQLANLIQFLRSRPLPKEGAPLNLEKARAEMDQITSIFPPQTGTRFEPARAGSVPAEWIRAPGASSDRIILYLHGGGYTMGSIRSHRHLVSYLSAASGARALAIDYRLAPECPHPAAVQDAVAAYQWLLDQGVGPQRIVIAGDSAGGGLTIATLVALRDQGEDLPAAAVCISPWVDLEGLGESMKTKADVDPMVQRGPLLAMAKHYLGKKDPRTPLASPLHADLAGLPPLLIQVGTHETLLDDAVRLAEKAKQAGVDVTLDPWEEMVHVWHAFAPTVPEAIEAIKKLGKFIRERTE